MMLYIFVTTFKHLGRWKIAHLHPISGFNGLTSDWIEACLLLKITSFLPRDAL